MATYVMLNKFTDQGIKNVTGTASRSDAIRDVAKKLGVTTKEVYWTLGEYDVIGIYDATDESAMTAFALAVGRMGNVRTQMLRAMNKDEMKGVLSKLGKVKEMLPA